MADRDFVRATVVDINRPGAPFPAQIVLDANVLYFLYYPNFQDLQLAGGQPPKFYQLEQYPRWVNRALRGKTRLHASTYTLGEFLRLAEYAEIESFWRTDPARVPGESFNASECKKARYAMGSEQLLGVRERCHKFLLAAQKSVEFLPQRAVTTDEEDLAFSGWVSSAGDFADAVLVAEARESGISDILTDDIDLLSFDQITVYTANRRAIDAARDAGRLAN